jgi:excisionase family DNA binding protein
MPTAYDTARGPTGSLRKELLSIREAAAYLGVSTATVHRRITAGTLPAQRWGRRWLMWRHDLDGHGAGDTGTDC